MLRRTGLPAGRLELEVTESLLVSHPEEALKALRAVKQMGVRISLDDFGTGYSSLSYLSRLPMSKLKIDRSLVKDILNEPKDRTITEAMAVGSRPLAPKIPGLPSSRSKWRSARVSTSRR